MRFRDTKIGNIPINWEVRKLGELADVISGYAFKSKHFIDSGIPVIKIKNIIPPYISIEDTQCVSEEMYFKSEKFQLKYDDILISMTGSNYNQMSSAVGKIGKIRIKNTKMLLNQRVGKILPKIGICDKEFMYQNLSTLETRYRLALMAGGSANQANVSAKQIKELLIPYPPLEEQKAIANILSTLDEKIETNNQINKRLEELAQTIFKHWFIDFDFPDENGKPYKSSGGEMIESELGMIPKGWEDVELNKLALLTMGLSPKSKSYNDKGIGIPLLNGAADFENGIIKAKKFTTEPTRICKQSDLVFCIRATIGNITFADQEFCLGRGVAAISPKKETYIGLIYFSLNMAMEKLKANATGSVILGLSKPDINNLKIVLPDENILKMFSKFSNNVLNLKHENEKQIEKLKNLRDTLLPKLMSGKIRVPLKEGEDR